MNFNYDVITSSRACPLYVNLTDIQNNKTQVFFGDTLSPKVIRAANCDAHLDQAIEIEGSYYWGGRYLGNPSLFPLFSMQASDLLIVQIDPLRRQEIPHKTPEIVDRVGEIMSNASLLHELRAIYFIRKLIDGGHLPASQMKSLNVHLVSAPTAFEGLEGHLRRDATWAFCHQLKNIGRSETESWLEDNFDNLTERGTVDMQALFE